MRCDFLWHDVNEPPSGYAALRTHKVLQNEGTKCQQRQRSGIGRKWGSELVSVAWCVDTRYYVIANSCIDTSTDTIGLLHQHASTCINMHHATHAEFWTPNTKRRLWNTNTDCNMLSSVNHTFKLRTLPWKTQTRLTVCAAGDCWWETGGPGCRRCCSCPCVARDNWPSKVDVGFRERRGNWVVKVHDEMYPNSMRRKWRIISKLIHNIRDIDMSD